MLASGDFYTRVCISEPAPEKQQIFSPVVSSASDEKGAPEMVFLLRSAKINEAMFESGREVLLLVYKSLAESPRDVPPPPPLRTMIHHMFGAACRPPARPPAVHAAHSVRSVCRIKTVYES